MATLARRFMGAAAILIAVIAFFPATATAVKTQTNIVGGGKASISDYPFAVFLVDGNGNQFCGGVLISSRSVATAAHCARSMKASDLRVVAGREDKRSKDGIVANVTSIWSHEEFKDPSIGKDIAVLKLDQQLPFKTARLASANSSAYSPGTNATVLGWGRTSEGGARSDYLRSATVPVVSDEGCAQSFSNYDAKSMVCAGFAEGGADACQGDSGGPLMVGDTVIGIVSYGEGCGDANKPGVYTRVSSFAKEIKAHSS